MIIGTDKERKTDHENRVVEWRVGVTPGSIERLHRLGHTCLVETGAGVAAGFTDDSYRRAGAEVVATQAEVYARADMIYKVKEPQRPEWNLFRKGQILFTYIHSGNRQEMLESLLEREVVGLAFEDVQLDDGSLPMLEPMSIIAGHISQQKAGHYLLIDGGNIGIVSGHIAGVPPANVTVIGTGFAGEAAIRVAWAMGSRVTALYNRNFARAERIMRTYPGVVCLRSTPDNVRRALEGAHVLNNCLTWPISLRDELLITAETLELMNPNGIVVDVSAELQGALETTRGFHTSHADPIRIVGGRPHYVVPNIPAIAARSASEALANATLPWAEVLVGGWDWRKALSSDPLYRGLTCAGGKVFNAAVREWYESLQPRRL